jgi:hypothetical protein
MIGIKRTAALGAAAFVMALGAAAISSATASATAFPVPVSNTSGCVTLEKVELMSGHDHMAEDPTVDDGSCWYGIWNLNTGGWAFGPTTSPSQSPWIYDGPGQSLSACVLSNNNPVWICGPSN